MRIRSLTGERRAVTAVEFAILLPALLTLICGSIEMGHMLLARIVLDSAVVDAARIATASLEASEDERDEIMRQSIRKAMSEFPTAAGEHISIETTVYRDFSTSYPENYTDSNENGEYDLGEDFTDRNEDGKWNPAIPVKGSKLGGPGDVVSYTAIFPKRILFGFLTGPLGFLGLRHEITLSATTVVRNENVVRREE